MLLITCYTGGNVNPTSTNPRKGGYFRASDISRGRGAAKFTKTRKIPRNSVEILSNTCLYNIFETYFSYWGYLLAVNLQIYLGPSSLNRANNVPKLPGLDYVAKNWALAMMLKALPLVHFWSVLLKEQMMTSVRKTLKMLVWSAQNWSISSEICIENNHKIGPFLPIAFWWGLPQKLPRNWPIFLRPATFDFFLRELSEALVFVRSFTPNTAATTSWDYFMKRLFKKDKNKNKIRRFRGLFCYGHTKILGL